jgi:hypothetical protein
MKWEITAVSAQQEVYELTDEDKKLMRLEFHPSTASARVAHGKEKRVFMIRKEGFRRSRTVFRNEYGVRLGHLKYDRAGHHSGMIELGERNFFYRVEKDPLTQLLMFEETNKEEAILACSLEAIEGKGTGFFSKPNELSASRHFLLLALGLYILNPVEAREQRVDLPWAS